LDAICWRHAVTDDSKDKTPRLNIRSGHVFDPERFKLGRARLVGTAGFAFWRGVMPRDPRTQAEICTLLWSILDRLDAAGETEAAVLLARVLDALTGAG
jgi:histidyl-tRNA synthetase